MSLSKDQIRMLTNAINKTAEHELDCDEFLVHLAEWCERVIGGESLGNATEAVQHHLSICPECNEEFNVLKDVLSSRTDRGTDAESG